jgi:hypothetical protein
LQAAPTSPLTAAAACQQSKQKSTMRSVLPADSPLFAIPNAHMRRNILLSFVIGFLLGFGAFVVGAVVCLEGTRALIRILLHRRKWLKFLHHDVPRLFRKTVARKNGTAGSIAYKMHRNHLTAEIDQCSVSMEYRITFLNSETEATISRLVQRSIDSRQNKKYSLEVIQYLLQQVQEEEEDLHNSTNDNKLSTHAAFLYMPDQPNRGLPLYYVENKRQEQIFWAKYVDIGIAFFGLNIYFLAAFIYGNLMVEDVGRHMVQTSLAPLLMAPYLVVQAQVQHQRRIHMWHQDPLLLSSEFETLWRYWHRLGTTIRRKIYTLVFLSGIVILYFCCGVMTVMLALAMIYSIVGWVDAEAPIQNETLQTFQNRATKVSATVVRHWRKSAQSVLATRKYFVRIQYTAPTGERVVKDVRSKLLFEDLERNGNDDIEVLVDEQYPLSGYPTLQFLSDFHHSWSLCTWHVACFGSMWLYLFMAAVALDVDLDDSPEESAISFGIMFITPILLLPHASVMRRKEYDHYLRELRERGEVVSTSFLKLDEEASNDKHFVGTSDICENEPCVSDSSSYGSSCESSDIDEDDW